MLSTGGNFFRLSFVLCVLLMMIRLFGDRSSRYLASLRMASFSRFEICLNSAFCWNEKFRCRFW